MKKSVIAISGLTTALIASAAFSSPVGQKGPAPLPPENGNIEGIKQISRNEHKIPANAPEEIKAMYREFFSLNHDLNLELNKDNPDGVKALEMVYKAEDLHKSIRQWKVGQILEGKMPKPDLSPKSPQKDERAPKPLCAEPALGNRAPHENEPAHQPIPGFKMQEPKPEPRPEQRFPRHHEHDDFRPQRGCGFNAPFPPACDIREPFPGPHHEFEAPDFAPEAVGPQQIEPEAPQFNGPVCEPTPIPEVTPDPEFSQAPDAGISTLEELAPEAKPAE